jgi:succinate-semialdehyde dehydrogenase/glutarate-semialdehyde dehydrogenase
MNQSYPDLALHIAGEWRGGADRQAIPVLNPATGGSLGTVPAATSADLDDVAESAARGFNVWRRVSSYDRSKVMRKAADLLRERASSIAHVMTLEQGKPLGESNGEVLVAADIIEWFAEEGRRTYGRVIPARAEGVHQLVVKEPVGPVAAFTPWNFPINQATRKISAALSTGCSIVLKGPEETPASCVALVRTFLDAGVPPDALGLVFGNPAEISTHLITHPDIRKISFTGSTEVGKQLAAQAGRYMKRATMELGGHAPAIVFQDADVARAVATLAAGKFRNAGQICIAPTRFLVHDAVFDQFVDSFTDVSSRLVVGDGLDPQTNMGPLAHNRRVDAIEALVVDAREKGAEIRTGGQRIGNRGFFFQPTVLTNVASDMRAMNEEPFGPVALIQRFRDDEEAFTEANRLPYGLAAYAFTRSAKTAATVMSVIESGMVSINHQGLAFPEVPFGGVKDSGYGSEGGLEAMEPYLNTRFISHLANT